MYHQCVGRLKVRELVTGHRLQRNSRQPLDYLSFHRQTVCLVDDVLNTVINGIQVVARYLHIID